MLSRRTLIFSQAFVRCGIGVGKSCATKAFGALTAFTPSMPSTPSTPSTPFLVLAAVLSLSACNPTFNWREIRIEDTSLVALMPCKPDHQSRTLPLAGQRVDMHMSACDTGGATFAIARVHWDQVKADSKAGAPEVLQQWRKSTLGNLGASDATESLGKVHQASLPPAVGGAELQSPLVVAQGKRPDGSAVKFQGVWFAHRGQIFHAALYAPQISAEMTETFFAGLKIQ